MNDEKTLVVLLGPTGVGKTDLSLRLAEKLGCPIISADSRQIYKDLVIGTAAPTVADLVRVKHYFVGELSLDDYFSAGRFEEEALKLLAQLHQTHNTVLMCGGSMMYIDAVCKGIDVIPDIDAELRADLWKQFETEGLEPIAQQLKLLDPQFYNKVDQKNHKRVIHALEVCLQTGKPYTFWRTNSTKKRPFNILKIGLTRDRAELYTRINQRVDQMMENGLLNEVQSLHSLNSITLLNSLNTVGYKELFRHLNGEWPLDFAVEKIKQNTRIYSRKQMTWFKRDPEIHWFRPEKIDDILKIINQTLG
ncbi:MAG: tRNA (adenosine(37)-N6)-dimethylallyltransferase MiaA [Candidatus Symbiothrix sp.]|jgi:tRNA dimethylallyltransferase|nr:tRNA (adenosine(37)-N6)-dimethylallyltransferase MiaA [Candidatus Symbiothrix sp.]